MIIYAVVNLFNFLFVALNVLIFIMIVDISLNTSNVAKKIVWKKYALCVELKNLIIHKWISNFNKCHIFRHLEWRKIKILSRIEEGQAFKMINRISFYKDHKSLACWLTLKDNQKNQYTTLMLRITKKILFYKLKI